MHNQVCRQFAYEYAFGDFVAEDIEVDCIVSFTYDRGYIRNRNGDGCPPSLTVDNVTIETEVDEILAQLSQQWDNSDGPFPVTAAHVTEWLKVIAERIEVDVEFDWDDLHPS